MATATATVSIWPLVKLGQYVDLLTGFPFKSAEYTEDESGIRLLRGDNVAQGYLRWDGVKRWPLDRAVEYTKYQLQAGDVILAMDRPWIEAGLKYAWVSAGDLPSLLVQRVARLRGQNGLDTDYLRYLIGSPAFTNHVHVITTGTAVPHISAGDIASFQFRLPPLATQRKIAAILSAYDDLIENNTRRIAILESMAQMLYREWFVHFRFPGHAAYKMIDSPLGPIPEDWRVVSLKALASISPESVKRGEVPDVIHYVDIASVSTGSIDHIEVLPFVDAPGRARRLVRHGDIIWSTVRPNRKSYSLILNPIANMVVSTGFAVIRPVHVPYSYLYQALTTDDFVSYLINRAKGAAYPAVSTEDFEDATVLLPSDSLLSQFHDVSSDLFAVKQNLLLRNTNLRHTRDLLLPRLISGEVDAENTRVETDGDTK